MNFRLSNGKWVMIGTVITTLLLLVGIYFLVLYPKINLLDQKEKELQTQQDLLSTIEKNKVNPNQDVIKSSSSLQKQIPVKSLSEQLLLEIEKAEVISGSFVVNMNFDDGKLGGDSEGNLNTDDDFNLEENQSKQDSTQQGTTSSEQKSAELELPKGLKKIKVKMEIESPSYFELESFLKTLENSERIIVVEGIKFTTNDEIIETNQKDKPFSCEVLLSAFYMPSLSDLLDQLPKIDSPEPAKKKNPFSAFSDYDQNNVENPYLFMFNGKDIIYTVKPGDTLYDISLKFYRSIKGIKAIRDSNRIEGNYLFVGEKLIIPFSSDRESGNE